MQVAYTSIESWWENDYESIPTHDFGTVVFFRRGAAHRREDQRKDPAGSRADQTIGRQ